MATPSESADDTQYWRIRLHKKKTKNWLLSLVCLFFFVAFAYLALTARPDYVRRAYTTELLSRTDEAQKAISQQIEITPQATVIIDASIVDRISAALRAGDSVAVARDGTIMAFSGRTETVFVLRPKVGANGKVDWTCRGMSIHGLSAIPGWCLNRQPSENDD
ncbi:MAG: hypothetical protein LBU53_12370 [Zoogloeaceae bacterium]|jgi:hypothetical protein|nr:hypothetical protein [Zoogloeaceae bacterium]